MTTNPANPFQTYLQQAYRAFRSGDFAQATRWAEEAIRVDPTHEEPWLVLASTAETPEESIEQLKRALEINPTSQRARQGMVWAVKRLRAAHPPRQAAPPPPAPILFPTVESAPSPAKPQTEKNPLQNSSNWSLIIGGLLVFFVLLLSIIGPAVAPHDPNKENYIFILGQRDFLHPPVPAFTLAGYPFGTDEWGRDIFSRLLFAIGPTINLVLIVAALRLVIGTLIGLISGWTRSWLEKLLDLFTSGAIAIPVIFVALFVIAATGQQMGIGAFVIGLSLTGWAETARIIREQTRVIKGHVYVEASQALGASSAQSLRRHVLPQVMPLIWILLPLEASSALLTTAALGFLGYFANVIWIPIGDWTSLRSSGVPDLGEMLALSAKGSQFQPWSMLAAGLIVFITVLGLNLLGDGLRIQFAPGKRRRSNRFTAAFSRLQNRLEDTWLDPLSPVRQNAPVILAAGFLALVLAAGGYSLHQSQLREELHSNITIPGNHLWASAARDAQNSLWVDTDAPASPKAIWKYITDAPIAGGPVIAADGSIYISLVPDQLLAISSEGQKLWQTTIPHTQGQEGVGYPAIGPHGDIYLVGFNGSLTAISPQGEIIWSVLQDIRINSLLSNPVIDAQGNIYYATEPKIYSVSATGEVRWQVDLPSYSYTNPVLRISGNGSYLIYESYVLDINSGITIMKNTNAVLNRFVIGTDGELYEATAEKFNKLLIQGGKATLQTVASWDPRPMNLNFNIPRSAGRLPSGYIWIEFGSQYNAPKIIWIDPNGTLLTPLDLPYSASWLILGIDRNNTLIICGSIGRGATFNSECRANAPGQTVSLWKFNIEEENAFPVGGALIPGRIYISAGNTLYALGNE